MASNHDYNFSEWKKGTPRDSPTFTYHDDLISPIFICLFSLTVSSSYAAVQDFCVADYTAPQGAAAEIKVMLSFSWSEWPWHFTGSRGASEVIFVVRGRQNYSCVHRVGQQSLCKN